MHALGFYHEQARPDAENFVKIQENVTFNEFDLEEIIKLFTC